MTLPIIARVLIITFVVLVYTACSRDGWMYMRERTARMLTRGEEWCADMWRGHARAVQKEKKTLLWKMKGLRKCHCRGKCSVAIPGNGVGHWMLELRA